MNLHYFLVYLIPIMIIIIGNYCIISCPNIYYTYKNKICFKVYII